jgi:FkbM family methyltransferase
MLQTLKRGLGRSYRRLNQNRIAQKLASWAALPDASAGVNSASDTSRRIGEERVQLYETSTGRYYLPTDAPQDCVISCIKSGGVFDSEVVETAKAYIRPGSTVLDVGANFGQMSVLFSRFVGAGGQVHSFEADPFVYELLQKTLAANNCQNVTAHLGAVYDRPNQQLFYPVQDFKRFPTYGSYGIDPNATAGRTVKTLTIDGLNINTPISFMKVDIQGSDLFALRGAVETIKRHRMPIIFEFEQQFQAEFGTSFQDYVDFVNSISYRFEKLVLVLSPPSINYFIVPR